MFHCMEFQGFFSFLSASGKGKLRVNMFGQHLKMVHKGARTCVRAKVLLMNLQSAK